MTPKPKERLFKVGEFIALIDRWHRVSINPPDTDMASTPADIFDEVKDFIDQSIRDHVAKVVERIRYNTKSKAMGKAMTRYLLLLLAVVSVASNAWADKIHQGTFDIWPKVETSTVTVKPIAVFNKGKIPLCRDTPYGAPCQELNKHSVTYYSQNPYNKPKPKPTIEWGSCVEWGETYITSSTVNVNRKLDKFYRVIYSDDELNQKYANYLRCTRQLGFRSDGVVVWRDPRREFW